MPEVGDTLGRYTLLKRLAVGGMGEVYVAAKAGPVGFGPFVALKVLRDELACDPQFVEMLVDEANISMFLNHQNVVSVLDLGEDADSYYIAMEYIQGITVERLMESLTGQGHQLPIPIGLYIGIELCRALKYAHTRVNHAGEPLSIVHRDVTPANILLSIQGEVKLTDFGIARAKGRIHQTQAGVLKGKFGYMAPEMVRYEQIDARADLFCAGVCLYLMLSGEHPVAGAAVMEAIQKYENKDIPPPSALNPEIPEALDNVIMKAMEPKVENRWASAADLADVLQDVLLSNASWRNVSKDGPRLISEQIKLVAADIFEAPISAEKAQKYLDKAKPRASSSNGVGIGSHGPLGADRPGALIPRPASSSVSMPTTQESQPILDPFDTEGSVPAVKRSNGASPRAVSGLGDVETDEQLSVEEIHQVRAELGARPQIRDTSEQAPPANLQTHDLTPIDDGGLRPGQLGARPTTPAHPPGRVSFPDSSTDRNEVEADYMETPQSSDDPTLMPGAYEELAIDRPLRSETGNDGETIIGFDTDSEEKTIDGHDLIGAPTLAVPAVRRPSVVEDDKTLAGGMSLADIEAQSARNQNLQAHDPTPSDDSDLMTLMSPRESGMDLETEDWERGTLQDAAGMVDGVGGDATLLDGIDADAVQDAIAQARVEVVSGTQDGAGPSAPAGSFSPRQDSTMASMEALVMDAVKTGPAEVPEPSSSVGPEPLTGPIRIVLNEGDVPETPAENAPAADASPGPRSAQQRRSPAIKPVSPALADLGGKGPAKPPESLVVGANTGLWMAGELDARDLAWDDDAAARRAVATRNKAVAGPSGVAVSPVVSNQDFVPGVPPPAVTPPDVYPQPNSPPAPSFWARHGLNLLLALALVVLAGLLYALFFTQLFWPRIVLESAPVGARVAVIPCPVNGDCAEVDGRLTTLTVPRPTPVKVQVDPDRRHRIEYRKAGYRVEVRDIGTMARFGSYKLGVELRPKVIRLPLEGKVLINGDLFGKGKTVSLEGLQDPGPLEIEVKWDDQPSYKVRYDSPDAIPDTLVVPKPKS